MTSSDVTELGQMLREARERRGVTLTDAQQATKIRLMFLQALENENYGVLPPPFYIRGFIKTYAAYLGLDSRAMVQLFDEMLENETLSRMSEQRLVQPSADSGGRGSLYPTIGLSQGEARLVEASSEPLNVDTLYPSQPIGQGAADSSSESRALVRIDSLNTTGLRAPQDYILRPAMLPSARGTFYMPNFIPAVLVGIIVLAACLLVYRGLTSQNKDTTDNANATATVAAVATNAVPTIAKVTTVASQSNVSVNPPGYASVPTSQSTNQVVATATAKVGDTNQVGTSPVQPTAPPTVIQVPTATATPANPIKVQVTISSEETKGSWLDVWVDDEKKISKLASAGESFTLQGNKIAIRAGKPTAITIRVNGEEREYSKPGIGIITHTWFADGRDVIE
jgi:cytoskeletal protein RodZ